jgi:hypothetical protein
MNYKVLFQKLYVVIFILLTVVVHLAEPVEVIASDASGSVDGAVTSFGFNNPVELSRIQIMDASGANAINSGLESNSLTRVEEFRIEFDIFDLDGFQHLDVYVILFNNNSAAAEISTASGVLAAAIDGGVTDNAIVYRWLSPERSTYLSGLVASNVTYEFDITSGVDNVLVKSGTSTIDENTFNSGITDFVTPAEFNAITGITWETASGVTSFSSVLQSGLVTTLSGTEVVDSGIRNLKYRVSIPFILSKVAPSSGVWNLGVMVHDRLQQEVETARTDEVVTYHVYASEPYENQFYGEVEILGPSAISFTNVIAGSGGFQISDQSGIQGVEVRFTSNGVYNQSVQTDSTWTPLNRLDLFPKFAYLTSSSGLSVEESGNDLNELNKGNRFALQARRTQLGDDVQTNRSFADVLPRFDTGNENTLVIPANNSTAYREELNDPVVSSLISVMESDSPTSEVGRTARFEFGLRLSTVFQNTTYTGNISIGISNGGAFFNPTQSTP